MSTFNNKKSNIKDKTDQAETWEDLFIQVIEKSMFNTHVSTLAFPIQGEDGLIQEFNKDLGYGIIKCKPFPLVEQQKEYIVNAYFFSEDAIYNIVEEEKELKKIVCILYTDFDFRDAIKSPTPKKTYTELNHSLGFAIIVKI